MALRHCAAFVPGVFSLPPQLLARAQLSWRQQKQAPLVSQLQRTVYHAFRPWVKVDHVELEYRSAAENFSSVDMLVRHRGAALALEVDGPWHFTANQPYKRLGSTLLRDRLLAAEGFTVVSVPFYEWEALTSNQARGAYLQAKLDAAADAAAAGGRRRAG
ncbi:hypothetical protein MNEG_3241 [Monoraphidium neglectum]|uniref:RAP domain-containing protein n=1 Tax=Monoraphidium neglectum TaxID=145388 RepID=A0A0D2MW70_9CHLO|nr:hypothetical protein MNEG_3241 [Monoraphidium neglectum]KIZ04722.1 hypothetical protein MNEG_3241 [Monoraphidium neglectum]|eukprot:XP_013903741.1 hypothetical protein MNEG_3241 [Monoraphidium neglectum]